MGLLDDINSKGYSGAWKSIFNQNYAVELGQTGNGLNIVADSTGPIMSVKGITGGSNVVISEIGNDLVFDASGGDTTLTSLGGVSLVEGQTGPNMTIHGLSGSAGISITDEGSVIQITNTSLNTDVTLISLGGISLVGDQNGPDMTIHGLTGGVGVTIADIGNTLEMTNDLPSPYQVSGANITPITSSVNAIMSGTNNTVNNCTNSLIGGSFNCDIIGSRTNYSAIIGSIDGYMETSASDGDGKNCIIMGSSGSVLGPVDNAGIGNGIYSSLDGLIDNRSIYCFIIGCNDSKIRSLNEYNSIHSSTLSTISGDRCNNCSIIGSIESGIFTGGAADGNNCAIVGSFASFIGPTGPATAGIDCGIYSSRNCYINSRNENNIIICGENAVISGGTTDNSVLMGMFGTISHRGNFLFSDSATGTNVSSTANHGFTVRSSGGARFFSNTSNTTGVSLASGGNSWATVSDRNVKENIYDLGVTGCRIIAEKFRLIPVCTYNYIGNPEEQLCYGPIAQDWNAQFGATGVTGPVLDQYGEQSLDPETNEPLYEIKPAKDPLKIEMMDMTGIMMATMQDVKNQIDSLQSRVNYLTLLHT